MQRRIEPGPHQESVWDYPRPPRVEKTTKTLKVVFNGKVIAETTNGYRVLETSHPPAYYIPQADIQMQYLKQAPIIPFASSRAASYRTIKVEDKVAPNAAWSYKNPSRGFEAIQDHICFYASQMDACYVDGELVIAQEGDFYGGWITSDIVGPFKGGAGTRGW